MGENKMIRSVIGIWKDATNGFIERMPLIYNQNKWEFVQPYVYNGSTWQPIGAAGTLMIPFITSTGDPFYDSNGKPFYVRSHS